MRVNFARNRNDSGILVQLAEKSFNRPQEVEGHIFWAHFAALELGVMYGYDGGKHDMIRTMDELKRVAHVHLNIAAELCTTYPGQTSNVVHEVDEVRRMLDECTASSEIRMVVAAMATEFSGTGHWYRCENGHPFTIGECGMPMQLARCPQCNAQIGGVSHMLAEGVTHDAEIERTQQRFEGMNMR